MTEVTATDIPAPQPPEPAPRPAGVPEKFWDPATGQVRVEALLKSYLELEKRLGAPADPTADAGKLRKALGVPDSPDGYCIDCAHGMFGPDMEVNAKLHAAGFAPAQAQLVYDLAAERLLPLVRELAAEFEAERELERLVAQFGGPDKWRETARQILAWAGRNLPAAAVEALAGTADGVMALYRMMQGAEPLALGSGEREAASEADLHRLVGDPRYWRDRDPAFVAKVTEGFRRAYGG